MTVPYDLKILYTNGHVSKYIVDDYSVQDGILKFRIFDGARRGTHYASMNNILEFVVKRVEKK